jgi:hypothetical protein
LTLIKHQNCDFKAEVQQTKVTTEARTPGQTNGEKEQLELEIDHFEEFSTFDIEENWWQFPD